MKNILIHLFSIIHVAIVDDTSLLGFETSLKECIASTSMVETNLMENLKFLCEAKTGKKSASYVY